MSGNQDRRRAIPCHGKLVSAGGSWTEDAGRLQRSYRRRWPDLHVLGPWSSFHSSSTFTRMKEEKKYKDHSTIISAPFFLSKGMNDHQSQSNQQFSLTFGVLTTGLSGTLSRNG
jgi:hypothetical protein